MVQPQPDFVIDVGMHDGSDTDYYLRKGYRVLAIDADPVACENARERFRPEIEEGRLEVLHVGISAAEQTMQFYRCASQPAYSSFVEERLRGRFEYEVIPVQCRPLSAILQDYGIPLYVKIDIEGWDEQAVRTMTPDVCPTYLSVELSDDDHLVDALRELGYREFKLIGQVTHRSTLPIFQHELGWRFLRKLSAWIPLVRWTIERLPDSLRPKKDWDTPYDPDGGCAKPRSGPFGEETHGAWIGYEEARKRIQLTRREFKSCWWDLHAKR